MRQFQDSFFLNSLDKLDVTENSFLFQKLKSSFFLRKINEGLSSIQKIFSKMVDKSIFLSQIDNILLGLITFLLLSLTIASTKIIGLLVCLCFAFFILKLFLQKGEKLSISVFDVQIFLYILIIFLSTTFSPLIVPATKGLAKVLVYFCSYIVFFNMLKNRPNRSYYFIGIIAFTVFAESLTAIFQNFRGIEALATWQDTTNLNPEQIMTRVYGTLKPYNPNLLAGYLTAGISSVIAVLFIAVTKKNYRLGFISLTGFLSVLSALVFTGSRGAYLGVSVLLTGIMLVSGHIIWHNFEKNYWIKRIWVYIALVGIFCVLGIIISSPALQHRIVSIFNLWEDSSNSFRLNVYAASIGMFLDNWLIGIGPGNQVFRLVYGLYMKSGFDALGAYSVPLEIAVESGIVALGAFIWLIVAVFIKGVKTVLYEKNIERIILIICCIAGIMGIMVHGLVDTIFFRPQVQIIFWLLIAILGANFTKTES